MKTPLTPAQIAECDQRLTEARRDLERRAKDGAAFATVALPIADGAMCQWCGCTAEEEAAHPEWHGGIHCPQGCNESAIETLVILSGHGTEELSFDLCGQHGVPMRMLFLSYVTGFPAFGGAE